MTHMDSIAVNFNILINMIENIPPVSSNITQTHSRNNYIYSCAFFAISIRNQIDLYSRSLNSTDFVAFQNFLSPFYHKMSQFHIVPF